MVRRASNGASLARATTRAFRHAAGLSGLAAITWQACATASRWAHRLPLSTVETYIGSRGAPVRVSYQFKKWPWWRSSVDSVASVASSRAIRSWMPIQPNWRAQTALSRYMPILVGEVRWASIS